MGKHETSVDYKKEAQDLRDKTNALKLNVCNKALELTNKYPDVIITEITTANEFKNMGWINPDYFKFNLKVISKIENHINGE